MEKIEVRYLYTGIDSAGGGNEGQPSEPYYHKYIVYTDSNGNQFAARGGTTLKSGDYPSLLSPLGKIETEYGVFDSNFIDYPSAGEIQPSEVIAEASDLSAAWNTITDVMDAVNNANLNYYPSRNSNSVIDTALNEAGLPEPTLDDVYRSPGSGNTDFMNDSDSGSDQDGDGRADGGQNGGGDGDGDGGGGGDEGGGPTPPTPPKIPDEKGSPLVLDLDGDGIELYAVGDYGSYFDMRGNGQAVLTGWVEPDDGLLALDINGDGVINDITELFGDINTDGFTALAQHDLNEDGVIDANDLVFADLIIWTDVNSDGVSQADELHSLSDYNIASISLDADRLAKEEIAGNDITHEATYTLVDGTEYAIVDAWFTYDVTHTQNVDTFVIDDRVFYLPLLRGFGDLKDFHITMSLDNGEGAETLISLVRSLASIDLATAFSDVGLLSDTVEDILLRWAGVDGVVSTSRGEFVDARHLEFYEAFRGFDFVQYGQPDPLPEAGEFVEAIFDYFVDYYTAEILTQIAGTEIFTNVSYNLYDADLVGDFTLIQAGIDTVQAAASDVNTDAVEVWTHFAQYLGYTKGLSNLTASEITALDAAVAATGEVSLSDWSDVVNAMTAELGGIIESSDDWGGFEIYYDNYTIGTSGNDTIIDNNANGYIDNEFDGRGGDDFIQGLDGHDKLIGKGGDDILEGGTGDDYLLGGTGDDQYLYESGNDTISEVDGDGYDELIVMASTGLTDANVSDLYRYGDDLIIFLDTGDFITVDNYSAVNAQVEKIIFETDNSEIDLANIVNQKYYGSEGFDKLELTGENYQVLQAYGYGGNDTIEAFGAGAEFHGGDGYDTLIGDYLNDLLYGDDGQDILLGAGGDDTLYGGDDNDTIDGGAGDDVIHGGNGQDIIKFDVGSGNDTIYSVLKQNDIVKFGDGVLTSDLSLSRGPTLDDLIMTIVSTGETLTVDNMFRYLNGSDPWWFAVKEFQFADGTVWTDQDVRDLYIAEHITSGDDTVYGFDDDNVFASSAGNDSIYGEDGNDSYFWGVGSGNDYIRDHNSNSDLDQLTLEGLNVGDISIDRSTNLDDLIITNNVTGGTVTIYRQFWSDSSYYRLDQFNFADGTVWEEYDVEDVYIQQNITSGDDVTYGFDSDNVFASSAGNDSIYGYEGNDSYFWGAGSGDDGIWDQGSNNDLDQLTLEGLNIADVLIDRSANLDHLIITNNLTGETITVDKQFRSDTPYYKVDQFNFADGTVLTEAQIEDLADGIVNGTTGNDTLFGSAQAETILGDDGNDVLIGNGGDDLLEGGAGDDTYVFRVGDGANTIIETSGYDYLHFDDATIAPEDVTYTRVGDDLHVQIASGFIIQDFYSNPDAVVEELVFSDGQTFDLTTLLTVINPIIDGVTAAENLADPGAILNGLAAISVAVWVQSTTTGTDNGIYDTQIMLGGDDILTMRYDEQGFSGGGTNIIKAALQTTEGVVEIESASNVQTTSLQHIVMTWESGDDLKLYIDGVQTTPTYLSSTLGGTITGIEDIILGRGSKPDADWEGSIDDFDVYDVALEAQYIAELYGADLTSNVAPVALDDIFIGEQDTAITGNVLNDNGHGYDVDFNGDVLSVTAASFTTANNGSVTILSNGDFTYVPDATFYGSDSFTYTLSDGTLTDTAQVNISVNQASPLIVDGVTAAQNLADPAATLNGLDQITVAMYVQASQIGTDKGVFDTEAPGGDDTLTLRYDASGYYGGGTNVIKAAIETTEGVIDLESASNVQTTDAQHLVMTWESGGALKLYINGVETTPTHMSGALGGVITGVEDLVIGRGAKNDGGWAGTIDDFDIYNVALDAQEVASLYGTISNEFVGSSDDDMIYGTENNDILYGKDGLDMLFGDLGSDTFVFESASAFNDIDVVQDFSLTDNDIIDVSDLLGGYDPVSDAIADFIQITDNGTDSFLAVDADGGADNFIQIATLLNVTGLTDEDALEGTGNLVTV